MTPPRIQQAIDAAFRDEWGRIVAALIGRTGNWDLAEECAQEAFAEALNRWPSQGVPDRPGAWLTTVAGNRAIDRLRREARGRELLAQTITTEAETMPDLFDETDEIEDDRLRLIFTCCHPALPLEGRVALTLRTLTGLTTAEIASAFLVPEATMAKRLTRTKSKITTARIPYRVPPAHLLPERTTGVLAVLYLMFNASRCDEAIQLTTSLQQLMPDEPEVLGALALMLLHHSRRDARVDDNGDLITLEDQNRSGWDSQEIETGLQFLDLALRRRQVGPYQLQAAIAACHARAGSVDQTDWQQIAGLYKVLENLQPSPVVRLNRAVAVAMAGDFPTALGMIDELDRDGRLKSYYLLEATRADLLRRSGDLAGAAAAYDRALPLAPTEAERRFLAQRVGTVRCSDPT